jgi:hypothetical protein
MGRKRVLFEQHICAEGNCSKLATEVDHITPLSQGGDRYARENLQGLCSYATRLSRGARRQGEGSTMQRDGVGRLQQLPVKKNSKTGRKPGKPGTGAPPDARTRRTLPALHRFDFLRFTVRGCCPECQKPSALP